MQTRTFGNCAARAADDDAGSAALEPILLRESDMTTTPRFGWCGPLQNASLMKEAGLDYIEAQLVPMNSKTTHRSPMQRRGCLTCRCPRAPSVICSRTMRASSVRRKTSVAIVRISIASSNC